MPHHQALPEKDAPGGFPVLMGAPRSLKREPRPGCLPGPNGGQYKKGS